LENLPLALALFGLYKVYAWLSAVGLRPPLMAVWLPLPAMDPFPVKFPMFIDPFIELPKFGLALLLVMDFFLACEG
jgi:hypothetical protein